MTSDFFLRGVSSALDLREFGLWPKELGFDLGARLGSKGTSLLHAMLLKKLSKQFLDLFRITDYNNKFWNYGEEEFQN